MNVRAGAAFVAVLLFLCSGAVVPASAHSDDERMYKPESLMRFGPRAFLSARPPSGARRRSDTGVSVPSLRPGGTASIGGLYVLSGSLHDHTTDSDGESDPYTIAGWRYAHRDELGIDYAGLAEHSDFFPAALGAPSSGPVWPRQAAVQAMYATTDFPFTRGFEWTNDAENHVTVVGSSNFENATGDALRFAGPSMIPFYNWLGAAPTAVDGSGLGYGGADGVAEFNHPNSKGALNFDDYAFSAPVAAQMGLIEIHGDQGYPGGLMRSDAGWYWFALSQGWTVSPVENSDEHTWVSGNVITQAQPGSDCGTAGFLPCQRTEILASARTNAAILDALRKRRTTASEIPSLWASLRATTTGAWQGSTVLAGNGSSLSLTVDAGSSIVPLSKIEIVADNNVNPYPYYYGDNLPCQITTVPVSFTTVFDPGCVQTDVTGPQSTLEASYVEQHQRYLTSGGHATKKATIDTPPSGTTVASVPLNGLSSVERTIRVAVPATSSLRPDGEHFYYAIVYAGNVRAWTGPILTSPLPQRQQLYTRRGRRLGLPVRGR